MSETKKAVYVAAALIVKGDKFLAARRGPGRSLEGYWELPGGKVEAGESAESACVREVKEELLCDINVDSYLLTCHYEYPSCFLTMDVFVCHLSEGADIHRTEHTELRFVDKKEMYELEFAPADLQFLPQIEALLTTLAAHS